MEKTYDLCLPASAADLDIGAILNGERLLRLHPHWHVENTEPRDNGLAARLRDHATDRVFSLVLRMEPAAAAAPGEGQRAILHLGISGYHAEELLLFADRERSRARVRYPADSVAGAGEQDVLLWIRAIQEYLRLYTATTLRTLLVRALMNRMVLAMNPSQRKICLMIARVTALEVAVILILVLGYAWYL